MTTPGEPGGSTRAAERLVASVVVAVFVASRCALLLQLAALGAAPVPALVAAVGLQLVADAVALASLVRPARLRPVAGVALLAAAALVVGVTIAERDPAAQAVLVNNAVRLVNPGVIWWSCYGPFARRSVPVALLAAIGTVGVLRGEYLLAENALATAASVVTAVLVLGALRRRGELADRLTRRLAAERAAEHERRTVRQQEALAARLVHDDVLDVLRWARDLARIGHRDALGRRARETLDRLEGFGAPPRQQVTPFGTALHEVVAGLGGRLDVAVDGPGRAAVPADVTAAMCTAVGEALRNVQRHAGTGSATVAVTVLAEDEVAVTVSDSGRGFASGRRRGGGIDRSIVAVMREVGGEATVDSAPGRGTRVHLSWRAGGAPPGTAAAAAGPASLVLAGDNWRVVGLTYAATVIVVHVVFAVLHRADSQHPWLAVALSVVMVPVTVALAGLAARPRPDPRLVHLCVAVAVAVLLLSTAWLRPGTVDGFAYWSTGATTAALLALGLLRPVREAVAITVAVCVAMVLLVDRASGGQFALQVSVVTPLMVAAPLGVLARISTRPLVRQVAEYHEALVRSHMQRAALLARHEVERTRVAGVRRRTSPLLGRLAAAGPPSAADAAEAGVLEVHLRVRLNAPELCAAHPDLAVALDGAAGRGVTVRVDGDDPARAARLAAADTAWLIEVLGTPGLHDLRLTLGPWPAVLATWSGPAPALQPPTGALVAHHVQRPAPVPR